MSPSSGELPDYYQVLGVPRTATLPEITAAYLLLAQQCHPDVNCHERETAKRFKLINEAHQVLSDAQKRREYDRQMGRPSGRIVVRSAPAEPRCRTPQTAQRPAATATRSDAFPLPSQEVLLRVTPEEARTGTWCSCSVRVTSPCPACQRNRPFALSSVEACAHCGGTGVVVHRQPLQLRLPAGLADGIVVEGPRVPSSSPGGCQIQLLLRIKIVPYW